MKERQKWKESDCGKAHWKRWGPYLSERQWGTVREDYSPNGAAWDYFPHDLARSRAYRWGEDGICGFSDTHQRICLALVIWNGNDPILKERLFGLTNSQGNHGEDVKKMYYYLDATPTHSYLKMLYKYPQREFPYSSLVGENRRRGKLDPEYELIDTGVFDDDRYFDVFVEYAKAGPDDILIQITAANRGPEAAIVHLLPHLWFRNTWSWGATGNKPTLEVKEDHVISAKHGQLGTYLLRAEGTPTLVFCENETNFERLYSVNNPSPYRKDGIDDWLVRKNASAVNPSRTGTKAAAHYQLVIDGCGQQVVRLRLARDTQEGGFGDFDQI